MLQNVYSMITINYYAILAICCYVTFPVCLSDNPFPCHVCFILTYRFVFLSSMQWSSLYWYLKWTLV